MGNWFFSAPSFASYHALDPSNNAVASSCNHSELSARGLLLGQTEASSEIYGKVPELKMVDRVNSYSGGSERRIM
jgi:hypothetical protein